jgi:hypothetical protein
LCGAVLFVFIPAEQNNPIHKHTLTVVTGKSYVIDVPAPSVHPAASTVIILPTLLHRENHFTFNFAGNVSDPFFFCPLFIPY